MKNLTDKVDVFTHKARSKKNLLSILIFELNHENLEIIAMVSKENRINILLNFLTH